jgi:hypothetical protein
VILLSVCPTELRYRHDPPAYLLRWSLANFLLKLASNGDSPDHSLLSIWDKGVSHCIQLYSVLYIEILDLF